MEQNIFLKIGMKNCMTFPKKNNFLFVIVFLFVEEEEDEEEDWEEDEGVE